MKGGDSKKDLATTKKPTTPDVNHAKPNTVPAVNHAKPTTALAKANKEPSPLKRAFMQGLGFGAGMALARSLFGGHGHHDGYINIWPLLLLGLGIYGVARFLRYRRSAQGLSNTARQISGTYQAT